MVPTITVDLVDNIEKTRKSHLLISVAVVNETELDPRDTGSMQKCFEPFVWVLTYPLGDKASDLQMLQGGYTFLTCKYFDGLRKVFSSGLWDCDV